MKISVQKTEIVKLKADWVSFDSTYANYFTLMPDGALSWLTEQSCPNGIKCMNLLQRTSV